MALAGTKVIIISKEKTIYPIFFIFDVPYHTAMTNKYLLVLYFLVSISITFTSQAQSRKFIDRSTDVAMFINPVAGFIGSLATGDYRGTRQLVIGGTSSIALTYILKYSIKKERPDGSDHHAFPSNHTAVAMQGATFLQRRYGWKFGIPAYAITA